MGTGFFGVSAIAPARQHALVVPSNTVAQPEFRRIYCRVAGDVVISDELDVELTYTLAAGDQLPLTPKLIKATGTTATLYGWR